MSQVRPPREGASLGPARPVHLVLPRHRPEPCTKAGPPTTSRSRGWIESVALTRSRSRCASRVESYREPRRAFPGRCPDRRTASAAVGAGSHPAVGPALHPSATRTCDRGTQPRPVSRRPPAGSDDPGRWRTPARRGRSTCIGRSLPRAGRVSAGECRCHAHPGRRGHRWHSGGCRFTGRRGRVASHRGRRRRRVRKTNRPPLTGVAGAASRAR